MRHHRLDAQFSLAGRSTGAPPRALARKPSVYRLCTSIVVLLALSACESGKKSARGFRLPDGNPEAGRAVFASHACHECHTVVGNDFPKPENPPEVIVELGGKVRRVKTYGQLVTTVINPSHTLVKGYDEKKVSIDGKSRMTNFNERMTVQELIDLVSFLQAQYEINPDDDFYYPYLISHDLIPRGAHRF